MHNATTTTAETLAVLRDRAAHLGRTVLTMALTRVMTRVQRASLAERRTALGMAIAGILTTAVLTGTASLADTPGSPAWELAAHTSRADDPSGPGRAAGGTGARTHGAGRASGSARTPGKPAAKKAPAPKWVVPMAATPLSSCYGPRWGTMHQGIDFAGAAGTKIRAVGGGTVVAAGWVYSGYGISVVVDHGNGYLSHYAHASRVLVHVGQKVKPGQALALEGSTGDSTGPHLHFEIHRGMWNQVDPAPWLRAHGVKVDC